ncbi:MAG: phosphatidylglycerophosphatase A [Chitinivibrionales bacterium]|nr:phosphatidylglycerophosphatase A [Chitinivibrionales bacterium]
MKKTALSLLRRSTSSILFIGYIPLAAGTIGSLITAAAIWYFTDTIAPFFKAENATLFLLAYCFLCYVAFFLADNATEVFGASDPKPVIIDECLGMIITFFLQPLSIPILIIGFCLFRLYDIIKPYPVHKFEEIDGGVGIVMDDVAAGIMANLSLTIIVWIYHAIKSHL